MYKFKWALYYSRSLSKKFRILVVSVILFSMCSIFYQNGRTCLDGDKPVHTFMSHNYSTSSVFYVWCESRWFEFSHYLSVLSVQRHLRPDNIIFYYETAPVVDKGMYYTWFNELKDKYPFFDERKLTRSDHACLTTNQANVEFIANRINKRGGIYVNESTILNRSPFHIRHESHNNFNLVVNDDASIALLTSRKGNLGRGLDIELQDNKATTRNSCVSRKDFASQNDPKAAQCINLNHSLFPKDIWELDDPFGRLARTLFYGSPEIRRATPSYDTLVPNIAHIVWTEGEIDFLFYLGVLSLIYVAKVDMVYIHGDAPPQGRYWDLVKNNTKIQLIYRESIGKVYGNVVKNIAHQSDTWRVDLMIKYGGIYIDRDAVFVRPLDQEIRGYDAVATLTDMPKWYLVYPNVFQLGVLIGKKNASFWHETQKSMKNFRNDDWCFNGCKQTYKIHERQPNLVKIDPHFQIECYRGKCFPSWSSNNRNESVQHMNIPSIKNWRKDAYTFHWTGTYPKELLNPTNLLKSKSMFSEIGQYVLQQAGMMEYFKKNS